MRPDQNAPVEALVGAAGDPDGSVGADADEAASDAGVRVRVGGQGGAIDPDGVVVDVEGGQRPRSDGDVPARGDVDGNAGDEGLRGESVRDVDHPAHPGEGDERTVDVGDPAV